MFSLPHTHPYARVKAVSKVVSPFYIEPIIVLVGLRRPQPKLWTGERELSGSARRVLQPPRTRRPGSKARCVREHDGRVSDGRQKRALWRRNAGPFAAFVRLRRRRANSTGVQRAHLVTSRSGCPSASLAMLSSLLILIADIKARSVLNGNKKRVCDTVTVHDQEP